MDVNLSNFVSSVKEAGNSIVDKREGNNYSHKYVVCCSNGQIQTSFGSWNKLRFEKMSSLVEEVLKSSEITPADKLDMLKAYKEITKEHKGKVRGVVGRLYDYLFGQGKEVERADSIINKGLNEYQTNETSTAIPPSSSKGINTTGVITLSNGTVCEGFLKDGKLEGKGKITFPNGTICEGSFKEGKLHGNAKIKFLNGVTYQGYFENGWYRQGTLNWKDAKQQQKETTGTFIGSEPIGQGTLMYPDGKQVKTTYRNQWIFTVATHQISDEATHFA